MILPDVNALVHAYNLKSPVHASARAWWERLLSEPSPVGLAWVVLPGFIRITTHPRVLTNPMSVDAAIRHVETWLAQPQVMIVYPGEQHASVTFSLLRHLGSAGNLTTDAHIAALAIELHAEVHSTDISSPNRYHQSFDRIMSSRLAIRNDSAAPGSVIVTAR